MDDRPPLPGGTGGQLNGWKEIAAYFRKGVRTVQRWEKTLSLPVHRIHSHEHGEIVYAFASELEAWRVAHEARHGSLEPGKHGVLYGRQGARRHGAPAEVEMEPGEAEPKGTSGEVPSAGVETRPHRRRWLNGFVIAALWLASIIVTCWVVVPAWDGWRGQRGAAQPAHWQVEHGAIHVLDSRGRLLWEHPFDPPLDRSECTPTPYARSSQPVVIDDIDADGRVETLVARPSPADPRLYVFNSDGTVRYTQRVIDTYRFGGSPQPPPHGLLGVFVTQGDGREKITWMVTGHHRDFASVLLRLDPQGHEQARYVSNGWISALLPLTLADGRRVILVGAANNEHHGGSLAVLDARDPSGSAPAATSHYQCDDCPAGRPLAFFVFPPLSVARHLEITSPVVDFRVWGDRFNVNVGQANLTIEPDPEPAQGPAWYTFGRDLRLVSASLLPSYRVTKSRLQRLGRLPGDLPPESDASLLPILEWRNGRFIPLVTDVD